jgi:hypothetical protein
MKIPEQVKIGWRNYKVEQGEHRAADNGGDLYGEIQYEKSNIFLYDKLPEDEKCVTLLHEILHGIFYITGHKDLRENESIIECISENLYQIIRDNPEMFKED